MPTHFRVRTDRVDKVGRVTLRYNSRLHHIGLGRQHHGTRVLLLAADLNVRILSGTTSHKKSNLTWNDVAQHPCTMSRDITLVPSGGLEPPHAV